MTRGWQGFGIGFGPRRRRQWFEAGDMKYVSLKLLRDKPRHGYEVMKELEEQMSAAGFYQDREAAQPTIDRHQTLMWEVGELMHQWEALSEVLEQE